MVLSVVMVVGSARGLFSTMFGVHRAAKHKVLFRVKEAERGWLVSFVARVRKVVRSVVFGVQQDGGRRIRSPINKI